MKANSGISAVVLSSPIVLTWLVSDTLDTPVAFVRDLQSGRRYKLMNAKQIHRVLDLSGNDNRMGTLFTPS